jgi:hypothetical protein
MQQKARLSGGFFMSAALSFPSFPRKRDEGIFLQSIFLSVTTAFLG